MAQFCPIFPLKREFLYGRKYSRWQVFVTARGWEDLSEILKSYEELQVEIGEELIGEFLQKEEIARDFAGYYRLYEKYKSDYQIQEILDGNVISGQLKTCCDMGKKHLLKNALL